VLFGEGGSVQARIGYIFGICWAWFQGTVSPQDLLRGCLLLTLYFLHHSGAKASVLRPLAGAKYAGTVESGTCHTKRVTLLLRVRKGKVLSAKRAKNRKLTASSVRYGCTGKGGAMTAAVSGVNLRKALGKKLDFGVYRVKKAPRRSAKLNLTFGWK
jgi:hypothetical protein